MQKIMTIAKTMTKAMIKTMTIDQDNHQDHDQDNDQDPAETHLGDEILLLSRKQGEERWEGGEAEAAPDLPVIIMPENEDYLQNYIVIIMLEK